MISNFLRIDSIALLEGEEFRTISSFRAASGARRLQEAGNILGNLKLACKIAQEIWCYELDESLVRELKLEGLLLSDGEIPVLSPKNWDSKTPPTLTISQWKEKFDKEGLELKGILLSNKEKSEFDRFLKNVKFSSANPWQILELVEHYFFPKNKFLKVVVSTRGRV